MQYTDSSSARQLACRQGAGHIRHLSGKILWVQERTQDGSTDLRQVPTAENVSDIATKVLSRGRLLYLMHETGLVYIPSFEMVGEEETANHKAKVRSSAQIKRIAKAVYRMSLVMGLGPLGAMGQPDVCPDGDGQTTWNGFWIFATVFFFTAALTVLGMVSWRAWKRLQQWRSSLENLMTVMERELYSAQVQLADHYEYAAMLNERLDGASEANESLTTRVAVFEEETLETLGSLQDEISCVRFGLMEYGGFVRRQSLTREERAYMLSQERGNFVILQNPFNHTQCKDDTHKSLCQNVFTTWKTHEQQWNYRWISGPNLVVKKERRTVSHLFAW